MTVRKWFLSQYNRCLCDLGFHIPTNDELSWMLTRLTTLGIVNQPSTYRDYLLMPPTYYLNRSSWTLNTSYWTHRLWSCTAESNSRARCFYINENYIIWRQIDKPANWFPIRAFKDKPVEPNNSWATLYQWTWSTWIFRNQAAWLISIVDGTNPTMTIQDHNLWATVVRHPWDTVTDDNAGLFYQWWNCHWFPYSWATTFYTTEQSVAGYAAPYNLYDDEHFVKKSSSSWYWQWNVSLWWGESSQQIWKTYTTMLELKNAYIWEDSILEYDFTKSDCWWTASNANIQRDSNWFYVSWWNVDGFITPPSALFNRTPKKIQIIFNRPDGVCWVGIYNSSYSNYWYFLPRSYNISRLDWSYNWTITQNSISLGTGDITWELDIDSSTTNWTITHKVTLNADKTDTSWALKYLWNNSWLWLRTVHRTPSWTGPYIKKAIFEF